MSTSNQSWSYSAPPSVLASSLAADGEQWWFALQTRARHEKAVARRLTDRGVETFLPLVKQTHRWSDRQKTVEVPLFGCYVFARLAPRSNERFGALLVDGVLRFVGGAGQGSAIPDEQIDAVRMLVEHQLPYRSHPFLKVGQRVRIRSGALTGVEGILVSRSGEDSLVVSFEAIQRSLAVRIEGYDIEPL